MVATLSDHLFEAASSYVKRNEIEGLRELLLVCPEVVRRRRDRSLIHGAAAAGSLEVVRLLLESGADPNMREGELVGPDVGFVPGYVPLHYAARRGHGEIVDLLLAHGADVNAADHTGGTALHGVADAAIAERLLVAGADPNAECTMRYIGEHLGWHSAATPLHCAGNDPAVIEVLVKHGASVDGHEPLTARTPLHYACERGHTEAVKTLLMLGADPSARCRIVEYSVEGRLVPLHYAAAAGCEAIVRLLVGAGADVNAAAEFVEQSGERSTLPALHKAASNGHLSTVRALLDLGARRDERGGWARQTALQIAGDRGLTDLCDMLENKALHRAKQALVRAKRHALNVEIVQKYPDTNNETTLPVLSLMLWALFDEGLEVRERGADDSAAKGLESMVLRLMKADPAETMKWLTTRPGSKDEVGGLGILEGQLPTLDKSSAARMLLTEFHSLMLGHD